jgi:hypothetical protein
MEPVPVSFGIYGKEMVGRTQSLIERKFVALSSLHRFVSTVKNDKNNAHNKHLECECYVGIGSTFRKVSDFGEAAAIREGSIYWFSGINISCHKITAQHEIKIPEV